MLKVQHLRSGKRPTSGLVLNVGYGAILGDELPFSSPPEEGVFLGPMEGAVLGEEEVSSLDESRLSEKLLLAYTSFAVGYVAYTLGPGTETTGPYPYRTPWAMDASEDGIATLYRYVGGSWTPVREVDLPYYIGPGTSLSFALDQLGRVVAVANFGRGRESVLMWEVSEGKATEVASFRGPSVLVNPHLVSGMVEDFEILLVNFLPAGEEETEVHVRRQSTGFRSGEVWGKVTGRVVDALVVPTEDALVILAQVREGNHEDYRPVVRVMGSRGGHSALGGLRLGTDWVRPEPKLGVVSVEEARSPGFGTDITVESGARLVPTVLSQELPTGAEIWTHVFPSLHPRAISAVVLNQGRSVLEGEVGIGWNGEVRLHKTCTPVESTGGTFSVTLSLLGPP